MVLPDGLTDDELTQNGFTKISDRQAKHNYYPGFRNGCEECSLWFKMLERRDGKMLCRK
jgi:hypothetical protein